IMLGAETLGPRFNTITLRDSRLPSHSSAGPLRHLVELGKERNGAKPIEDKSQPCQGWGRGFESLRPLQNLSRQNESQWDAATARLRPICLRRYQSGSHQ